MFGIAAPIVVYAIAELERDALRIANGVNLVYHKEHLAATNQFGIRRLRKFLCVGSDAVTQVLMFVAKVSDCVASEGCPELGVQPLLCSRDPQLLERHIISINY